MKCFPIIIIVIVFFLPACNKIKKEKILSDFTKEELAYFYEIAFYREFRDGSVPLFLWKRNARVSLKNGYTESDSLELVRVVKELNELIDGIEIKIVNKKANLEIHYLNKNDFNSFPRYRGRNGRGYLSVRGGLFGLFPSGYILIDKNQSIKARNHLVREELTQSLGLMKDSWKYPESIFYHGLSNTTEYSEIDRKIIQLLYNYNLPYAMKSEKFKKLFLKN
jgi:hypothetical protein